MKENTLWALWIFNATYLFWGGAYFVQDLNFEFVIYVGVIFVILATALSTTSYTNFPAWQMWLLSLWGLMHVLGGAVHMKDGVLFAHHIFPIINRGGDFYVLKYDQVVHAYLYGLVATMVFHVLRQLKPATERMGLMALIAILGASGVGALNEIMEFLISLNMKNGVGGYENTMLDIISNLLGAIVATLLYVLCTRKPKVVAAEVATTKQKKKK
jgi:putative membrane protein